MSSVEDYDAPADIRDHAVLELLIPSLTVFRAEGSEPFRAAGLLHFHPFYFEADEGYASLSVSSKKGSVFENGDLYYASMEGEIDQEATSITPGIIRITPSFFDAMLYLVPRLETVGDPSEEEKPDFRIVGIGEI